MSTGRNFGQTLRLLDSCQLTARHTVGHRSTGGRTRTIIPPSVSDEAAKQRFPNGWNTVKPYLHRRLATRLTRARPRD